MNGAIKQTQSELKGITTLLKLDPTNITLLTQKQKLLGAAVVDTKDKLDALKETQRLIDDGSIEATEEQYRDLEREIASTEAKLKKLSEEHRRFASLSAVQLQTVGKEFQKIGTKMADAGKSLLPLTAAIAAVGAASIAASIQFESSFAGVKKTVDATAEQLDKLAESARAAALVKPVDVNDINHVVHTDFGHFAKSLMGRGFRRSEGVFLVCLTPPETPRKNRLIAGVGTRWDTKKEARLGFFRWFEFHYVVRFPVRPCHA